MKQQFLFELEREAQPARILITRLPQDKLDWRPHSSARTLSDLAWHMSSVPAVVSGIVQHTSQIRSEVQWPARQDDVAEHLAHFDGSVATARTNLEHLSDEELAQSLHMLDGDRELFAMPREQFVRWGLLTHFVHHRAQLGVYLRTLGVLLPAIVGPSFDDNPFAPKT